MSTVTLQKYENHGRIGRLWYGVDGSNESTWVEHVIRYHNNVTRSREEQLAEVKRMIEQGVYEEENYSDWMM